MTYPPMWGHSPPPSHPPSSSGGPPHHDPTHGLNGHAVPMLLGRLLERSDHTLTTLGRIETRLEAGDRVHREHHARLTALETRPEAAPKMERLIKRHAAWLLPTLWLVATGNLTAALEILRALR